MQTGRLRDPRTPTRGARDRGSARRLTTRCCAGRHERSTVGDTQYFIEAYPLRPRLVVVGAVRSRGRSSGSPRARLRDHRHRRAVGVRHGGALPDVDRLVVGWPDEVAEEIGLGADDAVAVLTHDVKFDEPAIVEALRRGCRYVGAVGSKKTQADRRARLPRRASPRRSWTGCAARSGWTWVVGRRPRPRSRSSPRSSRSGTAGQACRCVSLRRRSAWSPSPRR